MVLVGAEHQCLFLLVDLLHEDLHPLQFPFADLDDIVEVRLLINSPALNLALHRGVIGPEAILVKRGGNLLHPERGQETVLDPVLERVDLDRLNKEGLVHRDIKPANILFFNGEPCLSDIGLLGRDGDSISMRGTPGYMPPSWFVESSGEIDMWGLATTLYSLLTGQNPDKMGKARFRQPIGGFDLMTSMEQKEWKRLYKVIDKATDENPLERFLSLKAFADALTGSLPVALPPQKQPTAVEKGHKPVPKWAVFAAWIFLGALAYLGKVHSDRRSNFINNDIKAATSRLDDRLLRSSENLQSVSESLKEQMEGVKKTEGKQDMKAFQDQCHKIAAAAAASTSRGEFEIVVFQIPEIAVKSDGVPDQDKLGYWNLHYLHPLMNAKAEYGYDHSINIETMISSSLSGDGDIKQAKQISKSVASDRDRVNQIITLAAKTTDHAKFDSLRDIIAKVQVEISQKGEGGALLNSKISPVLDALTLTKAQNNWGAIPKDEIPQYLLKGK